MNPELKTISYRGGLVTFRVPAHWVEEYEEAGGASFYEVGPDTPTFRLRTITIQTPSPVGPDSASDLLLNNPIMSGTVERLPNGNAIVRYFKPAVDRGQKLYIACWSVAQVLPPNHARIANFTYTLLDGQQDDTRFQREMELLEREIRSCIFYPALGPMGGRRNDGNPT